MVTIGYKEPRKYGVVLFDIIGNPVHDRQHCANTIKEAHEIAKADIASIPFGCACIYKVKNGVAYPVRNVTPSGLLKRVVKKGEE